MSDFHFTLMCYSIYLCQSMYLCTTFHPNPSNTWNVEAFTVIIKSFKNSLVYSQIQIKNISKLIYLFYKTLCNSFSNRYVFIYKNYTGNICHTFKVPQPKGKNEPLSSCLYVSMSQPVYYFMLLKFHSIFASRELPDRFVVKL